MTSYIKFIFKYLFEPETLSAELLEAADADHSNISAASSAGGQLANSSSSVSLTIINKSSGSSTWTSPSLSKLAPIGQLQQQQQQRRPAASDWLWLQQRQQQSADFGGDGGGSKLWPSKCLSFVRLFALAQGNNTASSGDGRSSGATSSAASLSGPATIHGGGGVGQLGQLSSPSSNSLLVRLGSFAEFEHLIRQQLAAAGPSRGGTNYSGDSNMGITTTTNYNNNNNNNNLDSQQNNNNNNNSHWQRPVRQAAHTTSPAASSDSFSLLERRPEPAPTAASPLADSPRGLLRLLIRSIEAEPQDSRQATGPAAAAFDGFQRIEPHHSTPATISSAGPDLSSVPTDAVVSSSELLDCYRGLQLAEYHQNYDIYIGLRIASTLTILFVVFILFVIYKTGCRDGDRPSRSQLRLTSSASGGGGQPLKPRPVVVACDRERGGGWRPRPQRGRTRRRSELERAEWKRQRPPKGWPGWPRAAADTGLSPARPAQPKATN